MVVLHLVFFSFFSNTFLDIRTDVLPKTCAQNYCIFSIKRPRRLFQTWHGGPGVSLNKQFIWARRHLLKKVIIRVSWPPCILPLNFKLIIQQINVWGAYLQFPLLYPAFIRGPAFNRENTVYVKNASSKLRLIFSRKTPRKQWKRFPVLCTLIKHVCFSQSDCPHTASSLSSKRWSQSN